MTRHPLEDAFRHNAWATVRLIDACAALTLEQLATDVPGTYGSIHRTLHHLVDSDTWYLSFFREEVIVQMDDELRELPELRAAIEANGVLWLEVLADEPDPDRQIEDLDGDTRYLAPVGVRLAQVVQHGTDHRSQVCTALTLLGVEPPDIAVWAYGDATGRDHEEKIEGAPIETAPLIAEG
jgi:uncharacterized damage-inducible protein DinB